MLHHIAEFLMFLVIIVFAAFLATVGCWVFDVLLTVQTARWLMKVEVIFMVSVFALAVGLDL